MQVKNFIGVVFEALSTLYGGAGAASAWQTIADVFNFLVNIIRDILVGAITLLGATFSQHFSNVITILTAVVQAFVFVVEKVREFGSAIASIFNGDIGAGVNILEKLGFSPSQIQTIITSVTQVKAVIRSFVDGVIQGFTQAYTFVKALFDFFTGNQTSGVDLLKRLGMSDDTIQKVSSIVEGVKSALNSLWSFFSDSILPILQDIGSAMLEGLTGIVTGIVEIVSGIIQVFFGWLSGDVESWKQGLKSIFDGVVTIVSSVFSTAFEIWKGIFQIGLEILASIWGALVDWISPYIQAVIDYVSERWNSLVESTMSILGGIGTFFTELWTQCVEITMSVLGSIGTFFTDLWTQCVEVTMSVLGGIGTFFSELWTQCVEITMNTLNSVLNFLGEWAANLLNFFAPAIGLVVAAAYIGVGRFKNCDRVCF
ncbi:phage tail protein [Bacillus paranthracis]